MNLIKFKRFFFFQKVNQFIILYLVLKSRFEWIRFQLSADYWDWFRHIKVDIFECFGLFMQNGTFNSNDFTDWFQNQYSRRKSFSQCHCSMLKLKIQQYSKCVCVANAPLAQTKSRFLLVNHYSEDECFRWSGVFDLRGFTRRDGFSNSRHCAKYWSQTYSVIDRYHSTWNR